MVERARPTPIVTLKTLRTGPLYYAKQTFQRNKFSKICWHEQKKKYVFVEDTLDGNKTGNDREVRKNKTHYPGRKRACITKI